MSRLPRRASMAVLCVAVVVAFTSLGRACPFCSAVSMTLSEEIAANDVAVIAELLESPADESDSTTAASQPDAESSVFATEGKKSKFRVVEVLRGASLLGDTKEIEVLYFGKQTPGARFLITGISPPQTSWATPLPLSERSEAYVRQLPGLPSEGVDRLVFFQEYFEDGEEMLARDAYDEFAKAPYALVRELKDQMHHDRLVGWIDDRDVPASRRRQYLTMLGVCGSADDLPQLEEMITTDDRDMKTALDALIACYLTLKGPDGMTLIEDRFLKDPDAEYTDTYAAIMALRFHGQEGHIIPKERLLAGLRHMLDRPQLADLVIPDLARWEDWSVMDRLVALFKDADEQSNWVRVPVVNYLRACPLPEAKAKMDELAAIDPDAVKRANSFFPFAAAPAPAPAPAEQPAAGTDATGLAAQPANAAADAPGATIVAASGTPAAADRTPAPAARATEEAASNGAAAAAEDSDAAAEDATAVAAADAPGGDNAGTGGTGGAASPHIVGVLAAVFGTLLVLFIVVMVILRGGGRHAATRSQSVTR